LTLGIRFALFLVDFFALLDCWVAIFDASIDLVSIYALNFLGLVIPFYCVYRKRRPKDDSRAGSNPRPESGRDPGPRDLRANGRGITACEFYTTRCVGRDAATPNGSTQLPQFLCWIAASELLGD
jgi:hypothetical protein